MPSDIISFVFLWISQLMEREIEDWFGALTRLVNGVIDRHNLAKSQDKPGQRERGWVQTTDLTDNQSILYVMLWASPVLTKIGDPVPETPGEEDIFAYLFEWLTFTIEDSELQLGTARRLQVLSEIINMVIDGHNTGAWTDDLQGRLLGLSNALRQDKQYKLISPELFRVSCFDY